MSIPTNPALRRKPNSSPMKQTRTTILSLAALLAGALSGTAQSGGPYRLNWHTIDGGGGRVSGVAFAIHGTIGQPESGGALRSDMPKFTDTLDPLEVGIQTGPVYVVRGGFWPGAIPNDVGPRLYIELDAPLTRVMLTWPFPSPGFALQQTTNFTAREGGWTAVPMAPLPVGTNWQVTFPTTNSALMYRLIKP